ncbi:hypothetical protein JSQ81_03225 [Sporosarcina sp. Marseille-Q4063]|uniref:hypothetical protein n=1 Tax=Sporosarcina sp. Marseille-Q4063 TaxID=2810514 RepID=UPI001BAFEF7E|nr:hypothetical protein [Sporosarcina sp. Marseille-Q4063]QUW22611.1 hypothetical protein JSQ81_03225 [Sporosarcina sp. Marseille-Q4063]
MMILVPFLTAVILGSIILLITWWFKKMHLSFFVRTIPGILTAITAIVLFYIGFVKIRGFEGAAYGIVAFFLIGFAVVSFIMAKKTIEAK